MASLKVGIPKGGLDPSYVPISVNESLFVFNVSTATCKSLQLLRLDERLSNC